MAAISPIGTISSSVESSWATASSAVRTSAATSSEPKRGPAPLTMCAT